MARFLTRTTPLEYVLSANLQRRHLNESQRAMIGQRLNTGGRANLQDLRVSRADAAKMLQVSPRSIADAKKVREHGTLLD